MKTKTINVSCRTAVNYRSYEVGITADLTENDNETECIKVLQARARKLVNEQHGIDRGDSV